MQKNVKIVWLQELLYKKVDEKFSMEIQDQCSNDYFPHGKGEREYA